MGVRNPPLHLTSLFFFKCCLQRYSKDYEKQILASCKHHSFLLQTFHLLSPFQKNLVYFISHLLSNTCSAFSSFSFDRHLVQVIFYTFLSHFIPQTFFFVSASLFQFWTTSKNIDTINNTNTSISPYKISLISIIVFCCHIWPVSQSFIKITYEGLCKQGEYFSPYVRHVCGSCV